jgi:outer membrane protein TolC
MTGSSMAKYCKNNWRRFLLVFCAGLFIIPLIAQPANGKSNNDSVLVLSPDEYLNVVRKNHPVAKQALLLIDGAEAQLLSARGFFDPSFYFSNQQKTFDGKNYYNYNNAELKVPTWFGIELKAGTENNAGQYANEELTLGQSSYAGFSIPLAKNLLMDRRRAALSQAKLMVSQSQAEQQLMLNDLLFNAIASYWNWVLEYQLYRILTAAVAINEDRYQLIRLTVDQGDRPGVDSTEALTQLLTFKSQQNEAMIRFLAAGFDLSNYMWGDNGEPYVLPQGIVPSVNMDSINPYTISYQPLPDLLEVAGAMHPKLQAFGYKIEGLQIEQKLKFQSLLPTVDLKYNLLADGYKFIPGPGTATFQNNYKFGLDVGMPLLLRQGRGDYKMAKLKVQNTSLELDAAKVGISNKVKEKHTELINLLTQVRINEQALAAFKKVLDVEKMKFEIGESSLFVLNLRENKVLEAYQKLAEVRAKFFKSLYGVQWAAGILR